MANKIKEIKRSEALKQSQLSKLHKIHYRSERRILKEELMNMEESREVLEYDLEMLLEK